MTTKKLDKIEYCECKHSNIIHDPICLECPCSKFTAQPKPAEEMVAGHKVWCDLVSKVGDGIVCTCNPNFPNYSLPDHKECNENWESIPYSSEHLWQVGLHGEAIGNCQKCGKPIEKWNEQLDEKIKNQFNSTYSPDQKECKKCKTNFKDNDSIGSEMGLCQDCWERESDKGIVETPPPQNEPSWEKELREKWSNSHGITSVDFIIQELASQKSKSYQDGKQEGLREVKVEIERIKIYDPVTEKDEKMTENIQFVWKEFLKPTVLEIIETKINQNK